MHKPIKSFVKRQRQLGITKQKIFDEMWPKYGLDITTSPISPKKTFGHHCLTLEIGFGNGETIFHLAKEHPTQDFIGIEVYKPGIAHLFSLLKTTPLNNIRIYHEDAVTVLHQCIPDKSLDKVLILFPDPWPKKRHHKRRLIQPEFAALLSHKLRTGGILHIVTDWKNYAEHIDIVFDKNTEFTPLKLSNSSLDNQRRPIITKFEKRGQSKGHQNFERLFMNK